MKNPLKKSSPKVQKETNPVIAPLKKARAADKKAATKRNAAKTSPAKKLPAKKTAAKKSTK